MSHDNRNVRLVTGGFLLAATATGLVWLSEHDYLLFHTIVELTSVAVAVAVFMLAWNARRFVRNDYLLFIAIAYAFCGAIDLLHTLAYQGMGIFAGTDTDANLPTQLWVAARYLQAASLLVAPVFLTRRLRPVAAFTVFGTLFLLAVLAIFRWHVFPVAFVGSGIDKGYQTRFKIDSEYIICAILAAAFVALIVRRFRTRGRALDLRVLTLISASIAVTIWSELAFTDYVSVYGRANMIGHLLKLLAVYLFYKALIENALTRPYAVLFRDLEQREQELRISEQRFRTLAGHAPVGIFQTNPAGECEFVNARWCAMTGISPEAAMGRGWERSLHPDDRDAVVESWYNTVQKGVVWNREHRLCGPNGAELWIAASAVALHDANGKVTGFIGTAADITERKHAEQERERLLAEQARRREFLARLIDSAPVGIAVFRGADLLVERLNAHFATVINVSPDAVGGQPLLQALPLLAETGLVPHLQEVRRGGRPVRLRQFETRVRWDSLFWDIDIVPLSETPGGDASVMLLTRDVTREVLARQRAEQLLRQLDTERARLKTIFDGTPEAIVVTDDAARVVMANPAAERLFQRPMPTGAEPVLHDQLPLCHGDGSPCASSDSPLVRSAREGRALHSQEMVLARSTGRQRDLLVSTDVIRDRHQRVVGAVGVFQDVTEIKKAERRTARLVSLLRENRKRLEKRVDERTADLQQTVVRLDAEVAERRRAETRLGEVNEELEQRAAQLRELASLLSQAEQKERRRLAHILHDHLQQIMVAAKLNVGMLQADAESDDVRDGLKNVEDLITQAVAVSRSLSVELSPPVLYDAGLAAAIDWLADWMADKHGLEVHVSADADAEPDGDDVRALLFEATRELLFNTAKHAGVRQAYVTLSAPDDDRVAVEVSDKGVGLDPARLDNRRANSVGFGLFSIRERLAAIGGEMKVDTAPGCGMRTTLIAPRHRLVIEPARRAAATAAAPAEAAAVVRNAGPARTKGAIRVVLADDHKLLRDGVAELLRAQPDIELIGEASDGIGAVELARKLQPDIVIMDVTMPRMNGIEATRVIAKEQPHVSVIGLSMHEKGELASAMRAAGACAYLTKGGPAEDLIAAIRDCSSQRRKPDPKKK